MATSEPVQQSSQPQGTPVTSPAATSASGGGRLEGLSGTRLTRLLALGLAREVEPIDALILRLEEPRGLTWLELVHQGGMMAPVGFFEKLGKDGEASLPELKGLKDRGNKLLKDPTNHEAFLAGMWGYFLAIAAAMALHHTWITGQEPERLAPILGKLEAASPEPWRQLFARARASNAERS